MIKIKSASLHHIDAIRELMQKHVDEGIVLERSYEEIAKELGCFLVALDKNSVVGVVSYHDYENGLYEIRSLVVAEEYKQRSIGKKLVQHTITQLRSIHENARIFALTYVPHFFEKLSFEQLDKDELPEKIWKDCINCPRIDCCKEIALIYRG